MRVLGPDHPDTLASGNNLADTYETAGRLDEAIGLYEQTLSHAVQILGSEHPLVVTILGNLANATRAGKRRGYLGKLFGR